MPRIAVKLFEPGQEETISALHNHAFFEWVQLLGCLYGYRKLAPEEVLSWLSDSGSAVWVTFLQGELVGYVHCLLEEIHGLKTIKNLSFVETLEHLGQSKIAVHPAFQRRGVAEALLTAVIGYYRQKGAETVTALAYNDNHRASAFFSKLGFKHQPFYYYEHYSHNDPFMHDSILAELDLRKPIIEIPSNPRVMIRAIQKSDLGAMQRIFGECRPDIYGAIPTSEQVEEWFYSSWAETTLVAELDGQVVGCMEYTSSGVIGIPGVLKKNRNQGVGSTLFHHLLRSMQEKGFPKALADTGIPMEEAIQMYRRFNFNLNRELWGWVKIL
ncbi:MAG: GNAT family N-acetyltransferase [Candidatus Thorarchaeota archaeon]